MDTTTANLQLKSCEMSNTPCPNRLIPFPPLLTSITHPPSSLLLHSRQSRRTACRSTRGCRPRTPTAKRRAPPVPRAPAGRVPGQAAQAAEDVLSKFLFEANRFASSTSADGFVDALLPSWIHSAAAARHGELMGYMSRQLKAGFFGLLYEDLRRLKGGPAEREQATDRSPWKHQTPTNHRTAAASTAVLDSGKKKKKKKKKEEEKESSGNKDEDHGADEGGDKLSKDSGDAEWVTVGGTRQVTAENAEEARDASGGTVDVDALLLQDSCVWRSLWHRGTRESNGGGAVETARGAEDGQGARAEAEDRRRGSGDPVLPVQPG